MVTVKQRTVQILCVLLCLWLFSHLFSTFFLIKLSNSCSVSILFFRTSRTSTNTFVFVERVFCTSANSTLPAKASIYNSNKTKHNVHLSGVTPQVSLGRLIHSMSVCVCGTYWDSPMSHRPHVVGGKTMHFTDVKL